MFVNTNLFVFLIKKKIINLLIFYEKYMNKNKIIIGTLLLFFTSFNYLFADDTQTSINQVVYDWYLSLDTDINLYWTNLWKCSRIFVNWEKLVIKSTEDGKIVFNYNSKIISDWKLELTCPDKIYSSEFHFPFITKISTNWKNQITIAWNNFWSNAVVMLDGWSFTNQITQDSIIYWDLPSTLNSENLYIEANWLKSNLYDLKLKNPKINFVYSNDWFRENSDIYVYWDNLSSNANIKVMFWDKVINNITYYNDKKYLSVPTRWLSWNWKIKVTLNWFESNGININLLAQSPVIEKVAIKSIQELDNWEVKNKEYVDIFWKNFPMNGENVKVYLNWTEINISKYLWNEFYTDKSNLKIGNNYYQVELNWKKSNIVNFKNEQVLPRVITYNIWKIEDGNRNISLYTQNFNIETDKIFFDWWEITVIACVWNLCRAQIPESTIKAEITAWNSLAINPNKIMFDIAYENLPYINYITFSPDISKNSRVEIVWQNFDTDSINISNLFYINEDWKIDMKSSFYNITWNISLSFDKSTASTININKYWQTADLSFIAKEINWTKIYGPAYIKELVKNWWVAKNLSEVKVKWLWFKLWDYVKIWEFKTPLKVVDSNNASFIIPDNIKEGEYIISIVNSNWFTSNNISLIIANQSFEDKIYFESTKIDNNTFYVSKEDKSSIYNLSVSNKIDDMYIKKISYKVEKYNKTDYLWTFNLKIWDTVYEPTLIQDNWIISFEWLFDLPKNINKYDISLISNSGYIKWENFKVNLVKESIEIVNKLDNTSYSSIDFSNINPNQIKVIDESINNCIDSKEDNSYCNSFIYWKSETILKTETNNTSSTNNSNNTNNYDTEKYEINSKYAKVYEKIDQVSSKLFESNKNKSYLVQLNTYKNLKIKISKISEKNKNTDKKIIFDYFYEKVDQEFKRVFKEYASQKK